MNEADEQPSEYRIEELAAAAGIPVRTLRYYQERRLLPAPRRQGRIAVYSQAHLDRLRLIGDLLERGYRLDGIEELLVAWEQGRDVAELLGFEWSVTAPWAEQGTVEITADQLGELFGDQISPALLDEAVQLGYLEVQDDKVMHLSPRLLDSTLALVQEGIPLASILAASWELQAAFDRMAFMFVGLVRRHVIEGDRLSDSELVEAAKVVERLRPVARTVAGEEFARAMDRRIAIEFSGLRGRSEDQ